MNAWGELAGIGGGALVSLVYLSPWAEAWNAMAYYQQLLIVVVFTSILTLVVVFLTPPESEETLTQFTLKVSPPEPGPLNGPLLRPHLATPGTLGRERSSSLRCSLWDR